MPKGNLEQQSQDEFDNAWNGVEATDESEDQLDIDTSDDAEIDEEDDAEEELTDEQEEADETDNDGESEEDDAEIDDKETQRLKSWEGRLKAEEARQKREREEWERRQQEAYAGDENEDEKDNQDTDESGPDDFEAEFPEFAEYAKRQAEKQTQPLQQKISAYEKEQSQQMADAHTNRIKASHPDLDEIASSHELDAWIENLPFKQANHYFQVKQSGTADEVINLLDDFKQSKSKQPQPKTPPSSVKTRRTAKPKGRVAKSDFDSAWDEATS